MNIEHEITAYVVHTDKRYAVDLYDWGMDYVVFKFDLEQLQDDFFSNFHKLGDLNLVEGTYTFRHERDSFKYTILLNVYDKKYVLDVMSIDYDWDNSPQTKKLLRANLGVLNTDERPELYDQISTTIKREINIENLLSES